MFDEARELYAADGRSLEEVLVLAYLSFVARMQEDMVVAESFARARRRDCRRPGRRSRALGCAARARRRVLGAGEARLALSQYEEAIPLRVRFGDPLLVLDAAYNLGLAAFRAGERERAREALVDALERARALGEAPYVAAAQLMLAELDFVEGDQKLLESRARESLTLYTDLDDDRSRARCLVLLAAAAAASGAGEDAARLVGAAEAARGSDAPRRFELPVLEQMLPSLRDTLGASKVESLKAEGDASTQASPPPRLSRWKRRRRIAAHTTGGGAMGMSVEFKWRRRRSTTVNQRRRRGPRNARRALASAAGRLSERGWLRPIARWSSTSSSCRSRSETSTSTPSPWDHGAGRRRRILSSRYVARRLPGLVHRLEAAELGDGDVRDDSGEPEERDHAAPLEDSEQEESAPEKTYGAERERRAGIVAHGAILARPLERRRGARPRRHEIQTAQSATAAGRDTAPIRSTMSPSATYRLCSCTTLISGRPPISSASTIG